MPKQTLLHKLLGLTCRWVLLLTSIIFGAAAQAVPATEQLKTVQQQITREENRLFTLKKRSAELEQALKQATDEGAELQSQKGQMETLLNSLVERSTKLQLGLERGKDRIVTLRQELRERVVAIYKMYRRAGPLKYLAEAHSAVDLIRRARYLARIAQVDYARMERLNSALDDFEREQKELVEIQKKREQNLEELKKLEQALVKKKMQQVALLEDLNREGKRREQTLEQLRKSAERLEKAISRLTGGEEGIKTVAPPKKGKTPAAAETVSTSELASRRGTLSLPVSGKLVRRFGRQQHEEFSEMVFVKGLEFSAAPASKVRAVADGKVAFNQFILGYGNLLIINHGKQFYSLYGRMAGVLLSAGDSVKEGDTIGVLGEVDKSGRNFYFELRIGGKTVDPSGYFKEKLELGKEEKEEMESF